ncbi:MAG: inositol monophosphatase family protein [Candidatus Eisenbacteria bacterium]
MSDIYKFAKDLAREAGAMLEEGHGSVERGAVGYKGWRNLVTQLDTAVEAHVANRIEMAFPDHGILAEEGVAKDGTGEFRWVIDPLDGTTNFVHRHPFYCVSIALYDGTGPLLGVIYAPKLGEFFCCHRGEGAELNGRRIQVSQETDLGRSLLASGFAYGKGAPEDRNLDNWARLSIVSRGLRRCGSAALDLAYVADGRYDGFWELSLNPWDVAAGALLVEEAGGRVTDCRGGDTYHDGKSIAATNGAIHSGLLEQLVNV